MAAYSYEYEYAAHAPAIVAIMKIPTSAPASFPFDNRQLPYALTAALISLPRKVRLIMA